MNRTHSGTLAFALLAILAPSVLSWVAYRGVSRSLHSEFERRLVGLAASTATQIGADDTLVLEAAERFAREVRPLLA